MSTARRITLFRRVRLFAPEPLGEVDILASERILAVGNLSGLRGLPGVAVESLRDTLVTPGFVDAHVHVAGGGGEGGFGFRTLPLTPDALLAAGITTAVGLLGTDAVTRSALGLLAEVRRLAASGISSYMLSGAYWVPTRTVTDSLRADLVVVPEVLGAGEIAVSDPRGADPLPESLALLAREVYVGALLAGKQGILHLHLGDEESGLEPVFEAWRRSRLPIRLFHPTHVNRRPALLPQAIAFARQGGTVDLTAGIFPTDHDPTPVDPAEAFSLLLAEGIPLERITVSSDSGGSSPTFGAEGQLLGSHALSPRVLLDAFRRLAQHHPLEVALRPFTQTPSNLLGLGDVGSVRQGALAHLLVFDDNLELRRTYVRGVLAAEGGGRSGVPGSPEGLPSEASRGEGAPPRPQ